jgi:hypothetical protein
LSGLEGKQLKRSSDGKEELIASHLEALNLRRDSHDTAILEVQIQADHNIPMANFKVRMQE